MRCALRVCIPDVFLLFRCLFFGKQAARRYFAWAAVSQLWRAIGELRQPGTVEELDRTGRRDDAAGPPVAQGTGDGRAGSADQAGQLLLGQRRRAVDPAVARPLPLGVE